MDVDFHNAISWFESQGVDVISSSIAINLKIYCELAYYALHTFTDINYIINILNHYEQSKEQWDYTINNAISKGITWSQASGNEGRKKWVGWFNDWDKDYYLNFEPYQNYNEIEFSNFTFGKEVYIVLLWGFDTGLLSYDDYDLYVTDEFGYIVASSEIKQSLIPIAAEACRFVPIPGLRYFVWVYQYWAATQEVGLLLGADQFPNFKHFTPEGTVTLNPPAHNPNVITVGAVPYYNPYQIEDFSSQGPTLEGVIKPDLVAPDGVSTSSYGWNGFYGTSAATPHIAGACALVKQAHPQWPPSQIKSFLESRAIDLGFPGKDNVYGSGLLSLGNPPLLDIPIPIVNVLDMGSILSGGTGIVDHYDFGEFGTPGTMPYIYVQTATASDSPVDVYVKVTYPDGRSAWLYEEAGATIYHKPTETPSPEYSDRVFSEGTVLPILTWWFNPAYKYLTNTGTGGYELPDGVYTWNIYLLPAGTSISSPDDVAANACASATASVTLTTDRP